ncbi:MAG: hypothetical protein DRI44_09120 [Chlamydiae bacterium]|nr:MAG: hypothetical protein DRI44_09120 [Chlamydiota bacterium]
MAKIDLIAFAALDEPLEQKRISLFLDSIFNQTNKNFLLYFLDCGDESFKIRRFPSNFVYIRLNEHLQGKDWAPSYIRNLGSLMGNSPFLCHLNSDNVYAPNFVETIVKNLDENVLVLCQRKNTSFEQFIKISTIEDAYQLAPSLQWHTKACCGDCQALSRELFIKIGGYYGLIENGKCIFPSLRQYYKEDTWLSKLFNREPHLKEIWVTGQTYMVHLFHAEREKIKSWHRRRR